MESLKKLERLIISIEGLSTEDYLHYGQRNIDFDVFLHNLSLFYRRKKEYGCKTKIVVKVHSELVKNQNDQEKVFVLFKDKCDEISIEHSVDMWNDFHNSMASKQFRYSGYSSFSNLVCPQIFKSLQVYANGDVTPCCFDWKRQNNIGNVMELSLMEIWNGEKLRELQMTHLQGKKLSLAVCKNCKANDFSDIDDVTTDREKILMRINASV